MSLVRVDVATSEPYSVHIGPGVLGRLAAHLPPGARVAALTDENVRRLHPLNLSAEEPLTLAIPAGEASKSFTVLEQVLEFLTKAGLDRSSVLVAIGGGVVGDLGGLAASLYMRGIPLVHCPTTLLAQVDAAVGGKTAVNLSGGKNLAGTFHQPRVVLADTDVLSTLEERDLRSGLGEVLKTALLGDGELFALLVERADGLARRDTALLAQVVAHCVRTKARLVAADEREQGPRKALNLGHTFGHGIEHAAGFGVIPHGEAVAVGVLLALATSARLGLLEEPELGSRTDRIAERLGLARSLGDLGRRYGAALTPDRILDGMRHDKKGSVASPALVLPRSTGSVILDRPVERPILAEVLEAAG